MDTRGSTYVRRIEDPEAFFEQPGHYHTTSVDQAYAVVTARSWDRHVKLGESLSFPNGEVLFFESRGTGITPNEMESWGVESDYYERRLQNYDLWEMVWWREVIQNARDARGPTAPKGPTSIELTCVPDVYVDPETGTRTDAIKCVCRDNGVGMDAETLRKAFFTKGGTMKPAGAVGGFGDAKELILTPWFGYRVHTRDVVAQGRHEGIFKPGIAQAPLIQGTEVTVWMSPTKTTTAEYGQLLVERCFLPGIRVTLNGKKLDATLSGGDRVMTSPIATRAGQEIGSMTIHHQPRARRRGAYIRANGVYMFDASSFVDLEGMKGVVYVDIVAPPRKVFTTKRDQLSEESTARNTIYAWLRRLAVDPKKMLKREQAERHRIHRIYKGTGAISVREGIASDIASEVAAQHGDKIVPPRGKKDEPMEISEEVIKTTLTMIQKAQEAGVQAITGAQDPVDLAPSVESIELMLRSVHAVDVEQVVSAIRFAAWKPDFFVHQELGTWKMPKKLEPGAMAAKYVKLARLWAELCKYTLIQVGLFRPFGVGWVFDTQKEDDGSTTTILGQHSVVEDMHWLLVCPIKMEVKAGGEGYEEYERYEETGDAYDLGSDADIEDLCSTVIHEVTHMQGFSQHDQAYAYQLTKNIRIALRGMRQVAKKILKTVAAEVREEFKTAREEKTGIKETIAKAEAAGLRWGRWERGLWKGYNDKKLHPDEPYVGFEIAERDRDLQNGRWTLYDNFDNSVTHWSTDLEAKFVASQKYLKAIEGATASRLPKDFYLSGMDDPFFRAFWMLFMSVHPDMPPSNGINEQNAVFWAGEYGKHVREHARLSNHARSFVISGELNQQAAALQPQAKRILRPRELHEIHKGIATTAWKEFVQKLGGTPDLDAADLDRLVKIVDGKYDLKPFFEELPDE